MRVLVRFWLEKPRTTYLYICIFIFDTLNPRLQLGYLSKSLSEILTRLDHENELSFPTTAILS